MHGGCSRLPWGLPSRPAPLPFGPPLPLVVLPPDGVSTLRYARGPVPPKRRAAALIGFAPFPLPPPPLAQMASSAGGKSLRARCGVPLRPPVPLLRRLARQRRRAAPPAGSRHPIFFGVVAVGSSGATPPPSPRSPVLLRAAKVGGLASAAFGRRAAAAARPSAPAPPPGFGPGAGLFCFRCGGFGDCAACGRR